MRIVVHTLRFLNVVRVLNEAYAYIFTMCLSKPDTGAHSFLNASKLSLNFI